MKSTIFFNFLRMKLGSRVVKHKVIPRAVHMVAIANRFDQEVLDQVMVRHRLKQKPIKLITYNYDQTSNRLSLQELMI